MQLFVCTLFIDEEMQNLQKWDAFFWQKQFVLSDVERCVPVQAKSANYSDVIMLCSLSAADIRSRKSAVINESSASSRAVFICFENSFSSIP